MRIMKNCITSSVVKRNYIKSTKRILYETIDFTFKPEQYYTFKIVKPTIYKIPKINYEEQYETRDF